MARRARLRGPVVENRSATRRVNQAETWLRTDRFDESSRELAEIRVRKHVIPYFGHLPMAAIKPGTVMEWDASLAGQLASSTRSVAFSFLSAIFTAAVDDGIIQKNPCSAKSVTQPAPVVRKVVPWRIETIRAIRGGLSPRYQPKVDVGAGCGPRHGEILGLSPKDFDFDGGWLHIRRQVKRVVLTLGSATRRGCLLRLRCG